MGVLRGMEALPQYLVGWRVGVEDGKKHCRVSTRCGWYGSARGESIFPKIPVYSLDAGDVRGSRDGGGEDGCCWHDRWPGEKDVVTFSDHVL
jgi:hypothetical protein